MNKLKIVPFFARLCDLVLRYMIWEGAKCNILHVLYCELFIFSFIAACHLVGVQEILTSGRIKLRNNKTIENEKDVYHDYIIKIFRAKCFLVEGSLLGAIPVYMTACVSVSALKSPVVIKTTLKIENVALSDLPPPLPQSEDCHCHCHCQQQPRQTGDNRTFTLYIQVVKDSFYYQEVWMTISLLIFSSLDEGTITKIPSPDVIFDIENPSSYRRKPSWYMRFRHRNKWKILLTVKI